MPGRSRRRDRGARTRALWRHGRGTQSRGGSLDGHYVAPARSVTAGIVPRLHLGGGAWERGYIVKMTYRYLDYVIAHNQWMK